MKDTRRLFLPGFTKAGSAAHFGAVWPDLAEAFDRLSDVDIDVIVDCGRVGQPGLPAALVERSAVTAVVLNSSLRSVMSARVHLPALCDHGRLRHRPAQPARVDRRRRGQPYADGEIAKALDTTIIGDRRRRSAVCRLTCPTDDHDTAASTARR